MRWKKTAGNTPKTATFWFSLIVQLMTYVIISIIIIRIIIILNNKGATYITQ